MKPYYLVSRDYEKQDTLIEIVVEGASTFIGEGYCTIIAGPCAVEDEESFLSTALFLKKCGVHILRGGLFKPRTSPYSFPGLGKEGLGILKEAKKLTGLPIVSEVMDVRELDHVINDVDMVQIGSRNMQNYPLLSEVGQMNKPILLKRGLAATVEEWLQAAEYVLKGGNHQVILCERGIRTFDHMTRNTVDIGVVPLLKTLTHLPVLVDPSHATGIWHMIRPVSKAAIVAGADGIMVEVHHNPRQALSDGEQSLTWKAFQVLYNEIVPIAAMENKQLSLPSL